MYGFVVGIGISPEYFLDRMSFDEVKSLLNERSEKKKRELELLRMNWFHTYRAFGAEIKRPDEVVVFEWEKPKEKIKPKKMSEAELTRKFNQARKKIKHGNK